MPANHPKPLIGGLRHTRSLPRYAGRSMRFWWLFFIPFMILSSSWQLIELFVLDPRDNVWWLIFLPPVVIFVGVLIMLRHRARVVRALRHEVPCPGCGYSVHEFPSCPECGLTMTPADRKQAWRDAGYTTL